MGKVWSFNPLGPVPQALIQAQTGPEFSRGREGQGRFLAASPARPSEVLLGATRGAGVLGTREPRRSGRGGVGSQPLRELPGPAAVRPRVRPSPAPSAVCSSHTGRKVCGVWTCTPPLPPDRPEGERQEGGKREAGSGGLSSGLPGRTARVQGPAGRLSGDAPTHKVAGESPPRRLPLSLLTPKFLKPRPL